jgi:hypothetical protein
MVDLTVQMILAKEPLALVRPATQGNRVAPAVIQIAIPLSRGEVSAG